MPCGRVPRITSASSWRDAQETCDDQSSQAPTPGQVSNASFIERFFQKRVIRELSQHIQGNHRTRASSPAGSPGSELLAQGVYPAKTRHVSQGQLPVRLSSVPSFGGGRPSWSGGLTLGPLPPRTACRRHRRIAPTAQ